MKMCSLSLRFITCKIYCNIRSVLKTFVHQWSFIKFKINIMSQSRAVGKNNILEFYFPIKYACDIRVHVIVRYGRHETNTIHTST